MSARKAWKNFNFGTDLDDVKKTTTKRRKSGCQNSKQKRCVLKIDPNFDFNSKLVPETVSDLAVHPKKVKEVENWLEQSVVKNTNNKQASVFLLLVGPTGSGKTTTFHVLCKNFGLSVSEWVNPIDQDYDFVDYTNQSQRFCDFLTESKWPSLFAGQNRKVLLVEDFPNAIVRNPVEFFDILEECYYRANVPVIFICNDRNDSKLAQNLFPTEIKTKYNIREINFNSCAPTIMKAALKRAHDLVKGNLELFKIPTQDTINAIIATSMGDIRSAMNQFYFACILGCDDLPVQILNKNEKCAGTKRKRQNVGVSTIQTMSRDENLGLFHGLGRVLNPKRTDDGRIQCNFDQLVDEFSTQPLMFYSFLFTNYLKYFGNFNDIVDASNILSVSQTLFNKWTNRQEIQSNALWISIVGLMIANKHKVSQWNQIRGPIKIKKNVDRDMKIRNLNITDRFYYNNIMGHKSL